MKKKRVRAIFQSSAFFLFFVFCLCGCASEPKKTLVAAENAVIRALIETQGTECSQNALSAENYLKLGKLAMENKAYEKAKSKLFRSLQESYRAHECAQKLIEPSGTSEEKTER